MAWRVHRNFRPYRGDHRGRSAIQVGPDGRSVGPGALLYPESLVGVWGQAGPPVAELTSRLLRVRADDFAEICSEPRFASELYRRLAAHLARLAVKTGGAPGGTPAPGAMRLPRPPNS